ncbi:PD40 domain-containing protein [Candidatus Amoebophilus asiaticus]|nr:PD40 domain-containing protein [Candidatus Amoebophilus asiaticus]
MGIWCKIGVIVCLFYIFYCCSLYGQGNSRAKKVLIKKAEEQLLLGDFRAGMTSYLRLVKMEPENPVFNYYAGLCYLEAGSDKAQAIPYLVLASRSAGKKVPDHVYYYLGRSYQLENRLDDAIIFFEMYERSKKLDIGDILDASRQIAMCRNAKFLIKMSKDVNVINMGKPINSSYSDFAPIIYNNGLTLIFTSRRSGSKGGYLDINGEFCSDMYISYKSNGQWTKPKNLSRINTDNNEICVSMTVDNKQLIFSRDDFMNKSINLFITDQKGRSFGKPRLLGKKIKSEANINTRFVEATACISTDGKTIYFSSNRRGGIGAIDLWKSTQNQDEIWSEAVNLGETINTPYNDETPFIVQDGKTIYFSSKGHNSMGGYDIFKSRQDQDGKWLKPVNLGHPINSTAHDIHFILTNDGRSAYFSSNRKNGIGGRDIYMFEMKKRKD